MKSAHAPLKCGEPLNDYSKNDQNGAGGICVAGGPARSVSGQVLTAGRMDAHNTFDAPDAVRPAAFTGARIANGRLTARLPAKSLVVHPAEFTDRVESSTGAPSEMTIRMRRSSGR